MPYHNKFQVHTTKTRMHSTGMLVMCGNFYTECYDHWTVCVYVHLKSLHHGLECTVIGGKQACVHTVVEQWHSNID